MFRMRMDNNDQSYIFWTRFWIHHYWNTEDVKIVFTQDSLHHCDDECYHGQYQHCVCFSGHHIIVTWAAVFSWGDELIMTMSR